MGNWLNDIIDNARADRDRDVAATPATVDGFDPGDHNVDDVLAYVDENPDETADVLAAELARPKPRKSIVDALSG